MVTVAVLRQKHKEQLGEQAYAIHPDCKQDYDTLFQILADQNQFPQQLLHLWNVTPNSQQGEDCFYQLLFLAQALGKQDLSDNLPLTVITSEQYTEIISKLRDRVQQELPLNRLFETPTVAGLAAMITTEDNADPQNIQRSEETDDLFSELNALSANEVDSLLNQILAGDEQ